MAGDSKVVLTPNSTVAKLTSAAVSLNSQDRDILERLYGSVRHLQEQSKLLSPAKKEALVNKLAAAKSKATSTDIGLSDAGHLLLRSNQLLDITTLMGQKQDLGDLLDPYTQKLSQLNPALFPFLDEQQRAAYKGQLLYTFYLLYAQRQIDVIEKRNHRLAEHNANIQRCSDLLEELAKNGKAAEKTSLELNHEEILKYYQDKPVKYLGLVAIAPWFGEELVKVTDGELSGKTITAMSKINKKRLYWVWGSSMLTSLLQALPNSFYNNQQAQLGVKAPSTITGYMSWVLYYARFGVQLFLLLKHVIKGPWMDQEEKALSFEERFSTQWQQRKFRLLNDSIWALANMACFLWLVGNGWLGYSGNVVTVALLMMDISLVALSLYEEQTKNTAKLKKFDDDIGKLNDEIKKLENLMASIKAEAIEQQKDSNELKKELTLLEKEAELLKEEVELLKKTRAVAARDWKYQRYGLINDLTYAVGLMFAFSLMCALFFPPAILAPATVMICSLAGAALCFLMTVATAAIGHGLKVSKTKAIREEAEQECHQLIDEYNKIPATLDPEVRSQKQKLIFLKMQDLLGESEQQSRTVNHQLIELTRTVFIDACMPALIFASLVFLPLGIGLPVLAAGFALAALSNYLVKQFAPGERTQVEFKQTNFDEFQEQIDDYNEENQRHPGKASLEGFRVLPSTTKAGFFPPVKPGLSSARKSSESDNYDAPLLKGKS